MLVQRFQHHRLPSQGLRYRPSHHEANQQHELVHPVQVLKTVLEPPQPTAQARTKTTKSQAGGQIKLPTQTAYDGFTRNYNESNFKAMENYLIEVNDLKKAVELRDAEIATLKQSLAAA